MNIAVDAVGGDFYPSIPVQGAIEAINEVEGLTVTLVGPKAMIEEELTKHTFDNNRIKVVDAPQIVGMNESPSKAIKTKQQSSIAIGLGLHKKGLVDGFVSAGNTGALLAASVFILGKLDGVLRPTIASVFPTVKGFRLLVDAGANLEVKPEYLAQFAIMGQIYAKHILEIDHPRIGLLNVGEEEEKGTDVVKAAFGLLKDVEGFVGNVEGRDILPCAADVFVCDGFTGNIALKFGESLATGLEKLFGKSIQKLSLNDEQAMLVSKVIRDALSPFDYQLVGGVPFLGVNGTCLVGHGSSSSLAIKNLINGAFNCVAKELNSKIVESITK